MSQKPNFGIVALALSLSVFSTSQSHAASMVLEAIQHYDTVRVDSANLTTGGSTDWAVWESRSSTANTNFAPTYSKSGGTAISNLTNIGGTGLRGTASATSFGTGRYTWSDGTPTLSQSNYTLNSSLIFNTDAVTFGSRNGKGLSFTVQGLVGVTNYLVLYLGGFDATGRLELTLNGATTIVDTSQFFDGAGNKETAAYQIAFTPNTGTDVLTVNYTAVIANETSGSNSHVGIEAISLGLTSVIPEPGSVVLGAFGAALLLGRRQRR